MGLQKQVKAAEDKLHEMIESEATSREVAMLEAKQQAIEEFQVIRRILGLPRLRRRIWKRCGRDLLEYLEKTSGGQLQIPGERISTINSGLGGAGKEQRIGHQTITFLEYSKDDCEIVGDK